MYKEYNDFSIRQLEDAFTKACENGELDKVKYLLTSPELKEYPNIHYRDDFGFRISCKKGHLNVAQYLACSSELKKNANIDTEDNYAFKWAACNNNYDIIKFFIFNLNIEKTPDIENFLISEKLNDISNMFEIRKNNIKLNEELATNKMLVKKPKI